jgi:hypothetical protein
MKGYPAWFVPLLVGGLGLMLVTGCLLAPTTLLLHADIALAWRLPGAGRVLAAALHTAGGFVLLLLLGALWSVHMRSGWHRRRQRRSGALLVLVLAALALTALGVLYLGEETLASAAALLHLGLGLALSGPFTWHWVHGRRERR